MTLLQSTLESDLRPEDGPSLVRLDLEEWQAFVDAHAESTPFHHRRWLELLHSQYQLPVHVYAWTHGGRVVAGLPFLETTTLLGRRKLVSLPFSDNVRALGVDKRSLEALRGGLQRVDFHRYSCVVNKTDRPLGFDVGRSGIVRHEIDLQPGIDHIERNFASSIKRNLKRAARADLCFAIRDDPEALNGFYRLHVRTRRKLGIPVQPRRYFERLFEEVLSHGLGFIAFVTRDRTPLSAVVFLAFQRTMIYKYAASDPAALDLRPNDFLVSRAIRYAAEHAYSVFDFGTSREVESGLRRFKQKWGAVESPMCHDCLKGCLTADAGDSRMMGLARTTIRHTPGFVCRGLGELLYKYSA